MSKPKGLYILNAADLDLIYGPSEKADISRHVDICAEPLTTASVWDHRRLVKDAEFIFSGWGGPVLDEAFLDLVPQLKVFFYGAGSLATVLTPAVWDRDIRVTTAIRANSVPVAEYALATILFSLKCGWRMARQTREQRTFVDRNICAGCYGSTVGLISMGSTARVLRELLRPFDVRVIAYDPFLSAAEAGALNIELCSLESLFEQSDVVSLHAPLLPETIGLITGRHLASMKQGSAFINTSRGTIVRQDELIEVASRRQDLQFVLDVAEPEPPAATSPLYTLENVVLTPHIAGSAGRECQRLGRYMVHELERFISGQPLKWELTEEAIYNTSHRPLVRRKGNAKPEIAAFVKNMPIHRPLAEDPVGSQLSG